MLKKALLLLLAASPVMEVLAYRPKPGERLLDHYKRQDELLNLDDPGDGGANGETTSSSTTTTTTSSTTTSTTTTSTTTSSTTTSTTTTTTTSSSTTTSSTTTTTTTSSTTTTSTTNAAAATTPALGSWGTTWNELFQNRNTFSNNWIVNIGTQYPGGPANWGTNEVETMTTTNHVVDTANHYLAITPTRQNNRWFSSRIETRRADFVARPGGRMWIDAWIWMPSRARGLSNGIWQAFWMLGNACRQDRWSWPRCGEIDILEMVNGDSYWHYGLHCDRAPGGICNEYTGIGASRAIQPAQWNLFGIQIDLNTNSWEKEKIEWYINDQWINSISGADFKRRDPTNGYAAWRALAQSPMLVILNVAIGGDFPRYKLDPSGNTPVPDSRTTAGQTEMWVWSVTVWNQNPIQSGIQYNTPQNSAPRKRSVDGSNRSFRRDPSDPERKKRSTPGPQRPAYLIPPRWLNPEQVHMNSTMHKRHSHHHGR